MLKLGEKGAIPQKDGETYGIAPHSPCGLLTPDLMRRLADVAEKYQVKAIKITGATRLALIGLKEADIDSVWEDLKLDQGAAVGLCIRSIRACPGNMYCKIGQQDALGVGLKLDAAYHGKALPGKFKMAVSGCPLSCAESWVRDIGLIGRKDGWALVIGGNVGANPRIAQELVAGLDEGAALAAVEKVIACYTREAQKGERLGKTIDRVGLDPFKSALA